MYLNTLQPALGAKKRGKRLGRGIGSGKGKTSGKGHKGQKARAGGFHKVGFEGGQMPLQRRIPKSGFRSRQNLYRTEVRLSEISAMTGDLITMDTLKAHGVINANIKTVKVVNTGTLKRPVTLQGIKATSSAKMAIEAAGGKVEG